MSLCSRFRDLETRTSKTAIVPLISSVIMVLQSNTMSLGKLVIKFPRIPRENLYKFHLLSLGIQGNLITNFPRAMVLLIISLHSNPNQL